MPRKGHPMSAEARAKISKSKTGKPWTPTDKERFSEAQKRRWANMSPEKRAMICQKMSNGHKASWTEERKARFSAVRTGMKLKSKKSKPQPQPQPWQQTYGSLCVKIKPIPVYKMEFIMSQLPLLEEEMDLPIITIAERRGISGPSVERLFMKQFCSNQSFFTR